MCFPYKKYDDYYYFFFYNLIIKGHLPVTSPLAIYSFMSVSFVFLLFFFFVLASFLGLSLGGKIIFQMRSKNPKIEPFLFFSSLLLSSFLLFFSCFPPIFFFRIFKEKKKKKKMIKKQQKYFFLTNFCCHTQHHCCSFLLLLSFFPLLFPLPSPFLSLPHTKIPLPDSPPFTKKKLHVKTI